MGVQRRTGCLCVSSGPGQKRYGGGSLALTPFSKMLEFPSTFIELYLAPLLKGHRNARPSHQHLLVLNTAPASVSCL